MTATTSEAALIDVRLDVGSLPPRSSSPTVAGGKLGGFSFGRDWWGGECIVGGVPRINIGTWGLCVIRDPTGKCPIWDRYGIDVLPLVE